MRYITAIILLSLLTFVSPYSTDVNSLQKICCACKNSNMVCNFCTLYTSTHACDLSGTALTSWSTAVVAFFQANFLPVYDSEFASCYGHFYFLRDMTIVTFTPKTASCTRSTHSARYLFGDAAFDNYQCASVSTSGTCGVGFYCETPIVTTSGQVNYCTSQYATIPALQWYDIDTYHNKIASPEGDCVEANYPALLTALYELSTVPFNEMSIDSYDENSMKLTVRDTEYLYNTYRMLQKGMPFAKRKYGTIETFCTDDFAITNTIFNSESEKFTWYLNVLIIRRGPCSFYVPYSSTQDICVDDLVISPYTASCPDTFRPTQFKNQFTSYILTANNDSAVCDRYNGLFDCAFKNWIDYFHNTSINSPSSPGGSYAEHARLTDEYAQTRQFGWFSWISSVFEPGIKLIFDIFGSNFGDYVITFFETLLEYILKIVLEIFNSIVELFKKSQEFINQLVDVITKILDVLFSLIAFILRALIGVLLKIEQNFLLFEYVILFLLVDYYIINNNLFSLLVILMVMVFVGIDRRSPSILLAFHSLEYNYVNLTGYDPSSYTWDYSLVYHSYSRNKTYNITLPPFPSLPDVPVYDTTPSFNVSYPLYEIPENTINCDKFPSYDLSGYFIH
uniref:Uncharacterized protein n=1 Tax=Marsac virus TaxID=1807804 RepID=A0A140HEP9_9VIRU|nr:hypothetical protein 2 [Marsac virus]